MNRLPASKKVSPAPPGSPPELQVQSQFSEGELANFRRVFDHYDLDGSGDIDRSELEAAFTSLNNDNPPPMGMIDDLMRRLDKDGTLNLIANDLDLLLICTLNLTTYF